MGNLQLLQKFESNLIRSAGKIRRASFVDWASKRDSKKYSVEVIVSCIDKVSEHAIYKKISKKEIWDINSNEIFKPIYNKVIGTKLFRLMNDALHKKFIFAGHLYLTFLKEQAFSGTQNRQQEESIPQIGVQEYSCTIINPSDVVSWLITQPNINGTLYLEHVAKSYMNALRNTPAKLQISDEAKNESVFNCTTVKGLDAIWEIYTYAPNYKEVNAKVSGEFSAGLNCLRRYLSHIAFEQHSSNGNDGRGDFGATVLKVDLPETNFETNQIVLDFLADILPKRFANGFRLDSPIELSRLRAFIANKGIDPNDMTDDFVKHHILMCGVFFDGKVYKVSEQTLESMFSIANDYFDNGARVIFYSELYSKNEDWLFSSGNISEDMMIDVLKKQLPALFFTKTYFGFSNNSIFETLESEILRIWGDNVLQNYEQLKSKLTYVPLKRIKYALGQNPNFIYSAPETFTHISKVEITKGERNALIAAINSKSELKGYASFTDLPLDSIAEHNHDLSVTAIHSSVFQMCLAGDFVRCGKIITKTGASLDALSILKDYCKTRTRCTLQELLDYERELTGENHRWIPMEAANALMVRIDKNNYVADEHVNFDVETIDFAIAQFVTGEYLPLKSFTTFGTFPDCGQVWNLFLLESFVRRFSKEFRFDTPSVNTRNAGTVIRKSSTLTYIEIMVDAVVQSEMPLDGAVIGKFLYEVGYTGRSSTSKMNEIIERAKKLREGRE